MRIDFIRGGQDVVCSAWWDGARVRLGDGDSGARDVLERIFRPSPVVVDDPALRHLGPRGESLIQPGSLEWFEHAALARGSAEGFTVRIVPEVTGEGGWD